MDGAHSIFLRLVVTHFSHPPPLHFARYVRYGFGNRGLHPQAVREALAGNPVCGTIPSCNLPRTTKDDASVCSSALRTQEYMRVRRSKRVYRIAPVFSPSA